MKIIERKKNTSSGFTLIEMLVAVLIFSLSLTALMNIASRGLRVAKNAERDVTADYLAIEALEITRNLRDNALLRGGGVNWTSIFSGGEGWQDDEGCLSDVTDTEKKSCNFSISTSGQPELRSCDSCAVFYNAVAHYYFQDEDEDKEPKLNIVDSGFTRKIFITKQNENEVVVDVDVEWEGGKISYSENLFLWQ